MKDRDAIELEKESTCEITVKSGRRVENRGEIEGQTFSHSFLLLLLLLIQPYDQP